MSEAKLISPLLDGFVMGNPMSSHDGVSCHPAIREGTDDKYIVKVISIPASQVQLDALLLTGAYKDPADAMDYFTAVSDGIVKEAQILQKLAKLEGFLSYESWQVSPMEGGRLGYQIYLLGSYKRSLERHMRRSRMTHLEAVNLGLDLCQALALCRRAGWMYVDLKPTNVFISKNKEYRIGDLGFVELESLKFSSLPGKYFSPYSPPECADALTNLDTTVDTYGAGMILYQVFNDGQLPAKPESPEKGFLPPMNADYEIASIIMKAIAPDPKDRWTDPMEMGQALVGYMQRNSVNNTPLAPDVEIVTDPEAPMLVREAAEQTKILPNIRDIAPKAASPIPEPENRENVGPVESAPGPQAPEPPEELPETVTETLPETVAIAPVEEIPETVAVNPVEELPETVAVNPVEELPETVAVNPVEELPQTLPVDQPEEIPATVPVPQPDIPEDPVMDREEAIAAQISSLFDGEEGLPQPETVPVSIPATVAAAVSPSYLDEDDGFSLEGMLQDEIFDDGDYPQEEEFIEDVPALKKERKKKKGIGRKIIGAVFAVMILALLACGGMWFYQNMYLQPIDNLEIVGSLDQMTVKITSNVDETLLSVTCADTYGNIMRQSVTQGEATFEGLLPNSQYKINLEINGFHKLTGKTSEIFNTAAQTNVVSFSAIAGPEDGSVLLNLVVDGLDPESWTLVYSAQGVEEQTQEFTGHSVTIKGLEVGKAYTFTLQDPENAVLTGETSVEFTSTELVMAENLAIVACGGGSLTARWEVPEGLTVNSWTVRCYNDADFEQIQENVVGTEATFADIDTTRAYTVEVTASGMTQPIRTSITSNPITITAFSGEEEEASELKVSWEHEGKAPVGGWLLMYYVDGAEKANVVKCDETSASISPRIPNATYRFEIQAADSTSIFSNIHDLTTKDAEMFDFEGITGEKIVPHLLVTPGDQDWTYESIKNDDFTDSFASGSSISVVLQGTVGFYIPEADINAMYVIRDGEGNVRYDLVAQETLNWKDLWYDGDPRYGELDLPVAPTEAGTYTVDIYFNDYYLTTANFTIE